MIVKIKKCVAKISIFKEHEGGLNLYNETGVINMAKDFTKTSVEYNWGFIDGLLWALKSGNKAGLGEILSMIENIRKTNEELMEEDCKRVGKLEIKNFET